VLVRASSGTSVGTVQKAIEAKFPNAQVASAKQVADQISGSLVDASSLSHRLGIALAALAALAACTVWTTVSIAWAPLKDAGLGDAERVWLYLGYALGAAILLRGSVLRWVEPAVAAGATIVAAYALATRLVPKLVPSEHSLAAGARLDQPLTYWNALGLLMAMAIVLLLRLASAHDRPAWMRTLGATLIPLPGLAIYLTFSRGALGALAGQEGLEPLGLPVHAVAEDVDLRALDVAVDLEPRHDGERGAGGGDRPGSEQEHEQAAEQRGTAEGEARAERPSAALRAGAGRRERAGNAHGGRR